MASPVPVTTIEAISSLRQLQKHSPYDAPSVFSPARSHRPAFAKQGKREGLINCWQFVRAGARNKLTVCSCTREPPSTSTPYSFLFRRENQLCRRPSSRAPSSVARDWQPIPRSKKRSSIDVRHLTVSFSCSADFLKCDGRKDPKTVTIAGSTRSACCVVVAGGATRRRVIGSSGGVQGTRTQVKQNLILRCDSRSESFGWATDTSRSVSPGRGGTMSPMDR